MKTDLPTFNLQGCWEKEHKLLNVVTERLESFHEMNDDYQMIFPILSPYRSTFSMYPVPHSLSSPWNVLIGPWRCTSCRAFDGFVESNTQTYLRRSVSVLFNELEVVGVGGLSYLHHDCQNPKIISEPERPLVGSRTSIDPRVVLSGIILFSARTVGSLMSPKSSRQGPCPPSLVYVQGIRCFQSRRDGHDTGFVTRWKNINKKPLI